MRPIYVTGHRNPDTDSIASAVAYADLRNRLDPENTYVPVRLGEINAQTRWVLDRAGVPDPQLLPHILLRVRDAMRHDIHLARGDDPVRQVGLLMAQEGIGSVPIVDGDGRLVGIVTERVLARRYIRESREASSLIDAPARVSTIAGVLGGEVLAGEADRLVDGRVWVFATDPATSGIQEGDVVVVGDRPEGQRHAIERGVDLLVLSNGATPSGDLLAVAQERGTAVVASPLDSYVTGRMISLSAPASSVMDGEPLTVHPDDLLDDVTDLVKDVHYRAAVAIDRRGRPVGLITRSTLVGPPRRRVILVDHAEAAQSARGIEEAEIVEILDHHHIGSIETHVPVRATFDPVGSTATLVLERFRQERIQPSTPTATLLLAAILSDTVILNSPTTTRRDRSAVAHLERLLDVDAGDLGREMFEAGSDVSEATAEAIINRDAKEYEVNGHVLSIAQIETVGQTLAARTGELLAALQEKHDRSGNTLSALMVTDILERGTKLLVVGEANHVERALGAPDADGTVDLPGVMSRKKQVAPRLLSVF